MGKNLLDDHRIFDAGDALDVAAAGLAGLESQSAIDELDAFLQVEGIDVFFIGPVDLAKSMGYAGDYRVPEVQRTMDEVIAAARAAGRHVGILVDDDNVAEYCRKGVRFLYTHANDFIFAGAQMFAQRSCGPSAQGVPAGG